MEKKLVNVLCSSVTYKWLGRTENPANIEQDIDKLSYIIKMLKKQRSQHKEIMSLFHFNEPTKYNAIDLFNATYQFNGCNKEDLKANYNLIDWGHLGALYQSDSIWNDNILLLEERLSELTQIAVKGYLKIRIESTSVYQFKNQNCFLSLGNKLKPI